MKRSLLPFALIIFLSFIFAETVRAQTTKTVGVSGADYNTLKAAFDAINAGSITGNITLQVIANTTETASAVLNFSGSGSSSYTSINIYPTTTGLSITGALAALPLIDLDGADNITIDGRVNASGSTKDLIITNTSTANTIGTSTIRFINDATSNTIKYCFVKGSERSDNAGIIFFSTTTGATGNDNNTIDNNDITCSSDANRPRHSVYGLGTSGNDNSGNNITNNNFYNFLSRVEGSDAMNLLGGNTDFTISGNSFYETATFTPTVNTGYTIITVNNSSGNNFTISGNYLGGSSPSCGGSAWTKVASTRAGFVCIYINVGTSTASNVQGNTIKNFNNSNSSNTRDWTGIIVVSGSVDVGTITGNIIGQTTGTGSISLTNVPTFNGITANGAGTVNIKNNTIGSITSTNGLTSSSSIYCINANTSGTLTVSDNTIGSTVTANSVNASSSSSAATQSVIGINTSSSGAALISGNTISNLSNNASSAGSDITGLSYAGSSPASTVSGNFICTLSLTNASSTSASLYGIRIASGTTTYSNNIISIGGNAQASVYGIADNGGTNNIYFNTVYAGGAPTTGSNTSYAMFSDGSNTRNYRNNIFVNARSNNGATGNHYAIGLTSAPATIDYNDYYVSGTNGVLGSFNAVNKFTLFYFQSSTAQDCNSYSADPTFASAGGTLTTNYIPSTISLMATTGTGITTDLGNNSKSISKPAMGAWEYAITPGANSLYISSFTPTSGSAGNNIVITGTNFTSATAVGFNGAAVTSFTVNSPTQITAATPTGATTGKLTVTLSCGSTTSTNDFTIVALLPVTWLSFTAQQKQNEVMLQWNTANEQNSRDFLVQYSTNGINWYMLGTVLPAGNSSSVSAYLFNHNAPNNGNNYYRLEQRDLDGRSSYSKVVNVVFTGSPLSFHIIGNPATGGLLKLQLSNAAEVRLYNQTGQMLVRQQLNPGTQTIPTTGFAKGLYLITAGSEVQKFVID